MNKAITFVNWVFGILILLFGILVAAKSFLSGVCFFLMAGLLLPPVRKLVFDKTNKSISTAVRGILLVILFGVGTAIGTSQFQEDKAKLLAEQQEQQKQQLMQEFQSNRDQIIADVASAIEKSEYDAALALIAKYEQFGDQQLLDLAKKTQTEQILAQLKAIPSKEYQKNKDLYLKLVELNPGNTNYQAKVDFYDIKLKHEEKIAKQFSPWDGSHRNLEAYIEKVMNDPSSYEHVETVYWDKGTYLRVKTTFRGKNAFGGTVLDAVTADVDMDGNILKIVSQ